MVNTEPEAADAQAAAVEAAMTALRSAYRRRTLARAARRRGERAGRHGALPDAVVELLDAVAAAEDRGAPLTVTEAAGLLGVDQPRASRLAARAHGDGLLRRGADQRDGRRSPLAVTDEGRAVLAAVRDFRRRVVAEALAEWPAADRAALARLLDRFVRDFSAAARN
ncbi:MarR family winged helix-turn-helix transcriptional regulator [Streptomonospora nanhaiensis]|uniref:DNA-binding MarR family transcriptional regulator n=1 Tax=Streptomonospora nanhaiensis TaxID=1323731 RepID=A0A853BVW2_9ACTN|nr:MarR family transcriptional regulator [Streptomonospora nanhaiensis]MBV2365580.1 MarR family transcriptional regulator [Streptomonospora nanhaiensis]MBX9387134.1 MarR family transcriptional regulator [Streptomonospora nanhaiensis]NYI98926.1 DNA-binding MarR family transcriptional regulator [Streptomonospora nanhaiensis]